MKRWTALSQNKEDKRWQYLSACLTKAGAPNEFVPWSKGLDPLQSLEPLDEFQHVRISTRLAPSVLRHVKVQSSWITLLGVIDGMARVQGEWWPLCALYESFGQILIELGHNLDKHGSVLIAGAGGAARTSIAAFFKAGFRNFLITNLAADEAQEMIRDVQAKFFGMNVQWVPLERIVLLPGESSVMVNCTPTVEDNSLLVELSYLNFLKRPGFLFDITPTKERGQLAQEAYDAGVNVVPGIEIAARSDVLWAKWAFQVDLDVRAYLADFPDAIFS